MTGHVKSKWLLFIECLNTYYMYNMHVLFAFSTENRTVDGHVKGTTGAILSRRQVKREFFKLLFTLVYFPRRGWLVFTFAFFVSCLQFLLQLVSITDSDSLTVQQHKKSPWWYQSNDLPYDVCLSTLVDGLLIFWGGDCILKVLFWCVSVTKVMI